MLKSFVTNFLKKGDVSEEWCEKITSSARGMKNFKIATTHISKNENENYEDFEFFGDTILNNAVVWWVKSRHPNIVNVEWLTKIKHFFVSTRIVSKLGLLVGVDKVVDVSSSVAKSEKSTEFLKIVEDVFEALIGATCQTFVDLELEHGVGIQVCQNIVWKLLDEINYPITYENIWDPPNMIKEMYDVNRWIFVWEEDNIPGVKDEKMIELRWWDKVSALSCAINDVNKRQAYMKLFMNYHQTNDPNKTFKIEKPFVKVVESFEFNVPVGSANRLPIYLFKQYFGRGETLVKTRCFSENEKMCKIELAKEGIAILKKNGYSYNYPPPMDTNSKKPRNAGEDRPSQPRQHVGVPQPQPQPQPQQFVGAPKKPGVQLPSHSAFPALESQRIKSMTQYFDWEKTQVNKNTKIYMDVTVEARKKGWIGVR